MAKASAYGCFLMGAMLIVFSIYAHLRYPQLRMAPPLTAFMGLGLLAFGAWYQKAAQKDQ